jgi:hypothetical protein
MAGTRKSAKRSASMKRTTGKKKKASKASSKSSRNKTKKLSRAARDGFDSVLEAGGKTWRTLKNTTALMVEGVKETLAGEPETRTKRSRRG